MIKNINRTAVGHRGEILARNYLGKKGFIVADSNFRCRFGEIDLIVRKDKSLRFIEVKLRRTLDFGTPQEAVVRSKQSRIRRTALLWLRRRHLPLDSEIHFDVLAISEEAGKTKYHYLQDAF